MSELDDSNRLQPHSEAKVNLYARYLSIYLEVLGRVPTIKTIRLFDLFCGEGRDVDGKSGSALRALEVIRNHYYSNGQHCKQISLVLNDTGKSGIEKGVTKIARVKRLADAISRPPELSITYSENDYRVALRSALETVRADTAGAALFLIDPYGYKLIKIADIEAVLACKSSEVILFVPISNMYRFANKASEEAFPGSEPLSEFLRDLFGDAIPHFTSAKHYADEMRSKLRERLHSHGAFVDRFDIKKGDGTLYCLFFFTTSVVGLKKMVEAKWRSDPVSGLGYDVGTIDLFEQEEAHLLSSKLEKLVRETPGISNDDVELMGLELGFLPKHLKQIFVPWVSRGGWLEVTSADGKSVQQGRAYIGNKDRLVTFKVKG